VTNRPQVKALFSAVPADLGEFIWAVGIEDTAIGETIRDSGRTLDEYELTEHYTRWRSDLDLVVDTGATAIRYGIPWYRVNPERDVWDWDWVDEVLAYAVDEAGLVVIADLVHYGTPLWLAGGFTDPEYPEAVATFAGRFAERYRDRVHHYTPLNEPLVTASFCGERAVWPPYETGDRGWARVVVNIAAGIQQSIVAIRAAHPEAGIVHVEAALVWSTLDPALTDRVESNGQRNHLPTDLVTGRVDVQHPLHSWLLALGIPMAQLAAICDNAQQPDVIGVNYYPALSCREVAVQDGELVSIAIDGGVDGLEQCLRDFHETYGVPVLLSETGVDGVAAEHEQWLVESVEAIGEMRRCGLPVVGFTWWPLFDFVDWSWASGGRVIEEFFMRDSEGRAQPVHPHSRDSTDVTDYLRSMGLYRIKRDASGLSRHSTQAVRQFQRLSAVPMPALPSPALAQPSLVQE
jgi:beta-glucosidase